MLEPVFNVPSLSVPEPPPTGSAPVHQPFAHALAELCREVDRGQQLIDRALSGGASLSAVELITLQAGIYRFSESVDLVAKIVDRAGQAVRTALSGSGG
jgi:hypothetical protein